MLLRPLVVPVALVLRLGPSLLSPELLTVLLWLMPLTLRPLRLYQIQKEWSDSTRNRDHAQHQPRAHSGVRRDAWNPWDNDDRDQRDAFDDQYQADAGR